MSEPKTNVPKFASFRPKPAQQQVEPNPKDRDEERHSSRNKAEKDHKSRHHKRHRSRSKDRNHPPRTGSGVSHGTPTNTTPDIFIIDRKGDVKNLVYGSIHRYSIPSFHRFGAGYVLGASSDWKIDRELDNGKEVILRNLRISKSGRREKYIFARVEKDRPRILRLRPVVEAEVYEDDTHADFVPLQAPRGRKRKREIKDESEDSESEQETVDYRSIYGKINGRDQPQDPDLQYATESDSSGSDAGRVIKLDAAVREKNVRLSRKVEEFPHDIDAWLELIAHQDVLIRAGDDRRRVTNAETRSTADIKIHMYEKALEKSQSLVDREILLQGLMTEGAKIWELKAQSDRWEQIAKENINSLLLWANYLNFKQSTFSTFRFEETKELCLSRIKLLLAAIEKPNPDSSDTLYQQIIYVILRFTLLVRESGYLELSLAIWQELLELNLCGSKSSFSREESTKLFQSFWESEVPRVGEDGALGWQKYIDNEDSSAAPEPIEDEAHGSLQKSQIFKSWAAIERQRSKCSQRPARTMDEVIEDDPFRVIMFSDIEDFLISFPFNLRHLCVDAFLTFVRLPPVASDRQDSRKWNIDQFIRNGLLDWELSRIQEQFTTMAEDNADIPGLKPSFQVILPNFHPSPESPFITSLSHRTPTWRDQYPDDSGPVPYGFIRNILRQLTQLNFTEDLAQYYLAFEYSNEPATIKKVAKGLLKQHPSSLKLYNAYALIERARGNKEVANGVFAAALNINRSNLETESKPDSILLWKSLAWICLEDDDITSSLMHLLSIPDGVPNSGVSLTPTTLLRAKQHITSVRDFLLSTGDPEHAVLYAECLALLIYLTEPSDKEPRSTSQGDITSALRTFTLFSESLATRKYADVRELFLQCAARLLVYHCNNGPYRPSLIRTQLIDFLTLYPQNTLFLSIYTANEARLRVENRVRSLFLSTILTPENDCLTSRAFAIQYEMSYGTIHSVKSVFEKAFSSQSSASSAGLWKLYLLWASSNEKQFTKNTKGKGITKEIWYRALRACPWAKELYILGFEIFGGSIELEFKELRGAWRVMGEKELRVHVDLEDEFEDIEESQKQKMIGDR